jgi:hypothetical protein
MSIREGEMERVERGNDQLVEWYNRPYAGSEQLIDCDAGTPTLTVTDPAGEPLEEATPMEKGTGTGYYYLSVNVPTDALPGWYNCEVVATTLGKTRYGYFGFEVV